MRTYKCKWCGNEISLERAFAAISRGKKPKYCSTTCSGSATTAAYRNRKKREH